MTLRVVLRSHILENYVAREFLKLMGLSLVTFVSLFIVVDFFEKIDRLVRAPSGLGALLEYLVLKLPFAIGQVLPAAVLLGVMLTFGLMSRSHETMAIRTSGLNILPLTRPTIIYSGVVTLLLLTLNLYLIPWSQGRLDASSGRPRWRRSRPGTCTTWSTSGTRATRPSIILSCSGKISRPWKG